MFGEFLSLEWETFRQRFPTRAEREAYRSGYRNGRYVFAYIDPRYTYAEIQAWAAGFMAGKSANTHHALMEGMSDESLVMDEEGDEAASESPTGDLGQVDSR